MVKANNTVIRFLPQNPVFLKEDTVLQAVLKDNKTAENEGYIEADAKAMLTRLGVDNWDQPCGELSGGQKKRLALVSVLLSPAEILILDEPTNHLDNTMADWLEDTLRKRKGAVIMVTHDRYFLDSVSDRIIEIDKGHIYSYEANYSGYLELKLQREEMEEASQRKRETILRNELKWVQRGARARSTKQKARLQRYEELKNTQGPVKDGQVQLSSISTRLGRTTVELEHICKSYGETVLIRDFTYIFRKDDRVGFIGRNGCGKSTLMKILTGQVEMDSGHLEIGQTVRIGYYAQELGAEQMNPQKRVIDYIRDVAEYVDTPEGKVSAARMLERFLFAGEDQYGLVGKLSGGEKRRLYLLKVLMEAPNVLILDEPTNDLDIATLRILEDYLDTFAGIVIVVSHDRYFLDRTVHRIFAFEEGGRLVQYEGGYTDYAARKEEEATGASVADAIVAGNRTGRDGGRATGESSRTGWKDGQKKKLRFTYQEQKEYETIEGVIAKLEETLEEIERKIPEAARDFVKLNELTMQKEETEKALEDKMERWMYLEDLAARIEAGEMV